MREREWTRNQGWKSGQWSCNCWGHRCGKVSLQWRHCLLEYVKNQWSTFLCGLAQSTILSRTLQQRPLLTTDFRFSTPLISSAQGRASWYGKHLSDMFPCTEQRVIFSTLATWSWKNDLFRTLMTSILTDTVHMVLHISFTWQLRLILTVAYGLWEACFKI
jgi:hypothetical protein